MILAEVRLWGRRIGAVTWDDQRRLGSFEYDPEFRGSGIEVSPIRMPLGPTIYQFPDLPDAAFLGLPGMLADSLPDRYGNALIDAWLARQGRARESFSPVERLCYVGTRGMGALEYQPAGGPGTSGADIDIAALVGLARDVLARRTLLDADVEHDEEAINQILQVGTSAGGARAKAVIAWNPATNVVRSGQARLEDGFSHWILKLDGVRSADDREVGPTRGYGLVEYAYHGMAARAGIEMMECRVLHEGGRHHFMTRRFDRTPSGGKLHLQSLAALAHFDYNAAGAHSYEQAIDVMRALGLPHAAIEQQFRRAVFNILARNQDDHVKNIAFVMDRDAGWSLSPAFDVIYAYNPSGTWTSRHQMSLSGKTDGFEAEDLWRFARLCDIKLARAKRIVGEVADAVRDWPEIAAEAGIAEKRVVAIARQHRLSMLGG